MNHWQVDSVQHLLSGNVQCDSDLTADANSEYRRVKTCRTIVE